MKQYSSSAAYGETLNCYSSGRKLSQYLFIKRVMKLTVVIIEEYNCCQLCMEVYTV
jgi:hypothetical protein